MSEWIDITRPVDDSLLTWPGREQPKHCWEKSLTRGDHCNVSSWEWNAHSGTHMDAPLHFIADGKPIDRISPKVFFGNCKVIELSPRDIAPMDEESMRRYAGIQRLLIRTGHSEISNDRAYAQHEGLMTEKAAEMLVNAGLVLIGTDRLSVDATAPGSYPLHHIFLGAGCVIVEGLILSDIAPGDFYLSAAPLRLTGKEASPVRAFLKNA